MQAEAFKFADARPGLGLQVYSQDKCSTGAKYYVTATTKGVLVHVCVHMRLQRERERVRVLVRERRRRRRDSATTDHVCMYVYVWHLTPPP